jgi:hypothetical protein
MNNLNEYLKMERNLDLEKDMKLDKRIQDWVAGCVRAGCVGWPGSKETYDRELNRAQGGPWGEDMWMRRYER